MKGTFIFRADGNAEIGAGHLMRCLTVAAALRKGMPIRWPDSRVVFFCADEDSCAFVRERGFEALAFHTDYRRMETELPFWKEKASATPFPRYILTDSYYVTAEYLRALGEYGRTALFEDKEEMLRPVDMVINYHIYTDRKFYDGLYRTRGTALCLGKDYVPLRPEFLEGTCLIRETAEDILITTGGADRDNIGGDILRELMKCAPEAVYHLVTGSFNPHLPELKQMAERFPNVIIEQNVKDMASLMKKCDICVSAGGTTVYELAALGVPFICFSYAENQEKLTEYIGSHHIAGFAGAWHRDKTGTLKNICGLFRELAASQEMRSRFHSSERALIDGRGAERIAGMLTEELYGKKEHEQ